MKIFSKTQKQRRHSAAARVHKQGNTICGLWAEAVYGIAPAMPAAGTMPEADRMIALANRGPAPWANRVRTPLWIGAGLSENPTDVSGLAIEVDNVYANLANLFCDDDEHLLAMFRRAGDGTEGDAMLVEAC